MSILDRLNGEVEISDSADALANRAASMVAELSSAAIAQRGSFSIALSGGTTPAALFRLLAGGPWKGTVEWRKWQVFWADERACPPEDPASNFHLATSLLLAHVPIEQHQIHRMTAESPDLDAAAQEYSNLLAQSLGDEAGTPRLDCILLGLGENGHTASLFPGTPALDVVDAWCTRGIADYQPFDRMTLTYPAINAARNVAFMVTGSGKAAALQGAAEGTVPAARIAPTPGGLTWLLDRDAAKAANALR